MSSSSSARGERCRHLTQKGPVMLHHIQPDNLTYHAQSGGVASTAGGNPPGDEPICGRSARSGVRCPAGSSTWGTCRRALPILADLVPVTHRAQHTRVHETGFDDLAAV